MVLGSVVINLYKKLYDNVYLPYFITSYTQCFLVNKDWASKISEPFTSYKIYSTIYSNNFPSHFSQYIFEMFQLIKYYFFGLTQSQKKIIMQPPWGRKGRVVANRQHLGLGNNMQRRGALASLMLCLHISKYACHSSCSYYSHYNYFCYNGCYSYYSSLFYFRDALHFQALSVSLFSIFFSFYAFQNFSFPPFLLSVPLLFSKLVPVLTHHLVYLLWLLQLSQFL